MHLDDLFEGLQDCGWDATMQAMKYFNSPELVKEITTCKLMHTCYNVRFTQSIQEWPNIGRDTTDILLHFSAPEVELRHTYLGKHTSGTIA